MAGITERNQQKNELVRVGFSLRYIDEWPAKTALYRHKPSYNTDGEITEDLGTAVKGVPGSPDYVLRKARIGLFPWPPSDACVCQWCKEREAAGVPVVSRPEAEEPPVGRGMGQRGKRRMGPHFQHS
jgi:hypothetical protein